MLLDTVSNAFARFIAPAPASGYFAKKALISSNFVSVANVFVIAGISAPRFRSFKVYLPTRNSQLERTQSQTIAVPSGFAEMAVKQPKKSCART